jgi:glycosyltransferase involved in cell wall biosynthesis
MIRVSVTSPQNVLHNSFYIVRNLLIKCIAGTVTVLDSPRSADLHIHVGTPEPEQAFMYAPSEGRLIFYSFAEAPQVPEQWVTALNKCLEVWVSSEFTKKAFLDSGVTAPIRLIPLGVDLSGRQAAEPAPRAKNSFTVLWQGTRLYKQYDGVLTDGDRKRGYLVERAFRKAKLPRSRLILKWLPENNRTCNLRVGPVWYICQSLSSRQMSELDAGVDLFVWPTMGEGFGLIPLEKLSRGIPALVTNWSGPKDYLKDFPISHLDRFSLESVVFNGHPVKMAIVDESYLIEALKLAYEKSDQLRSIGGQLAQITRERWSLESRMRPRALAALHSLTNGC